MTFLSTEALFSIRLLESDFFRNVFSQEASGSSFQGQQVGCHNTLPNTPRHVHVVFDLKLGVQLPVTESSRIIIKKKLTESDLCHLADVVTKIERGKIIWPRSFSSLVTGLRQIPDLLPS